MRAETGESVQFLTKILDVSRAGYHQWQRRAERPAANVELRSKIIHLHDRAKGRYGVERIYNKLKDAGEAVSRNRVHRQMKAIGIRGKVKKRFIPKTTASDPASRKAPRIFKGSATPVTRPNEVWVGDISYIPTKEGFLYLAICLDVFSRMLVGWSLEDHMEESLVSCALKRAVHSRGIEAGELKVLHTDQGSQYEARLYRELLQLFQVTPSMSRRGNCYDNAFAETFFKTLKSELELQVFETKEQASQHIFEFIEAWYNTERIHSSLGFMSPLDYEKKYYEQRQAG